MSASDQDVKPEQDIERREYREKSPDGSSVGEEPIVVSVEERQLVRRLDRRILPIACLMYLFACKSFLSDSIVEGQS